ncbi:MAG TPA: autotransporter outer membrane beta-barrel domain-containing protein, partial [Thermopetrobacter sp.]|nr:autotransporter outer membrane beta-barrel domain-containing protein [Thermopetrobacter sp.]
MIALATLIGVTTGHGGAALAQDYPQWPYPQDEGITPGEAAVGTLLAASARRQWRWSLMRGALLFPAPGASAAPAAAVRAAPVSGEVVTAAGWTVMKSGEFSRLKDARSGQRRRGHAVSGTLALERGFGETLAVGASVGVNHTSLKTLFNNGRSRVLGVTVTPYVALTPTEWLTFTLSGGYVGNHEKLRWAGGAGTVRGRRHSDGYTVSAVVEASTWHASTLFVSLRGGVVASGDNWKGFTDTLGTAHAAVKERLVQASVEGSLAAWLEPVMPSLTISYTYDLKRTKWERDRDDVTVTAGLAWYGSGA